MVHLETATLHANEARILAVACCAPQHRWAHIRANGAPIRYLPGLMTNGTPAEARIAVEELREKGLVTLVDEPGYWWEWLGAKTRKGGDGRGGYVRPTHAGRELALQLGLSWPHGDWASGI